MGLFCCFSPNKNKKTQSRIKSRLSSASSPSPSDDPPAKSRSRADRKQEAESQEALMQDKVLEAAAALILGDGPIFDRSASARGPPGSFYGGGGSRRKQQGLPRSSSTRPRAAGDPLLPSNHLLNQVVNYFISS